MTAHNVPSLFRAPGQANHPLSGMPMWAAMGFAPLAGNLRGMAWDGSYWPGPIAEGTDGGIVLSGVTGAATITRRALNNVNGGIRLTVQATADANAQIEIPLMFGINSTDDIWFFAKVGIADTDDIDVFIGLGTPGNTDFIAGLPAEGLFFLVEESEGDGTVSFFRRDGGTSTEQSDDILTAVTDTAYILGFRYIAASGTLTPYAGTNVNALTAGTSSTSTTNLPDDAADELSLYFGVETGNGEADYLDIYSFVAVQGPVG